jgi:hypothetical protein
MPRDDIKAYRVIEERELTADEREVLRKVSRRRVRESLERLLGGGKVSLSAVQAEYGALMSEVGQS